MKHWRCDRCGVRNQTSQCSKCKEHPYLIIEGKGLVEEGETLGLYSTFMLLYILIALSGILLLVL